MLRAFPKLLMVLLAVTSLQAEQSGSVQANDQCSFELEAEDWECILILHGDGTEPKQHPGGNRWDFWLEELPKLFILHSQNDTRFAKTTLGAVGEQACRMSAYKEKTARIDRRAPDFYVCVRLRGNRYAELQVVDHPERSGPLRLNYVLWK